MSPAKGDGAERPQEELVICPACGGTGCETTLASADVPFLFPCCEICSGRGRLTRAAYHEFIDRQDRPRRPRKTLVLPTPRQT